MGWAMGGIDDSSTCREKNVFSLGVGGPPLPCTGEIARTHTAWGFLACRRPEQNYRRGQGCPPFYGLAPAPLAPSASSYGRLCRDSRGDCRWVLCFCIFLENLSRG